MNKPVTLNQLVAGSIPARGTIDTTAQQGMKQQKHPVEPGQTDDLFAQLLAKPQAGHNPAQPPKTDDRSGTKPRNKERVVLCSGIKAITPVFHDRNWKLFKRSGYQQPEDPWFINIEWKGREMKRNTGTADPDAAWKKAMEIIDAVIGNDEEQLQELSMKKREPKTDLPEVAKVAQPATIGEILKAYENATDIEVSEEARIRNAQCMRNILRKACGMTQPAKDWSTAQRQQLDAQTDAITLDRLTEDLAGDLRLACNATKDKLSATDKHKTERTWASLLAQGLSVFKAICLHKYKRSHLVVPACVEQFHKAAREQFDRTKKADYYPPSDEVIDATIAAWQKLSDRDMFIKIGLELACGLRDGEVEQLRWGMFTVKDGEALLDTRLMPEVEIWVKGGSGKLVVTPLDPYWAIFVKRIKAEGWKGKRDEALLTACTDRPAVKAIDPKTGKERTVSKSAGAEYLLGELSLQISAWLREQGWTTAKTNHALRAFVGSQIIAKWGPYAAQKFLQHASIETAETHYSYFVKRGCAKPEAINIAWGRTAL